jgi:ketosteroid isomerase-like protein
VGRKVSEDFRQRLAAAYDAWGTSAGTTPAQFFDLMDEAIEFHTVLEREFPRDPLSGPFSGRAAVIGYWTAIAESWELVSSKTDAIVADGDRVVWVGRVRWRNRRTLRELVTPKVDIWTVWRGRAIRYLEMFDSAGYARAAGHLDAPAASPVRTAVQG